MEAIKETHNEKVFLWCHKTPVGSVDVWVAAEDGKTLIFYRLKENYT